MKGCAMQELPQAANVLTTVAAAMLLAACAGSSTPSLPAGAVSSGHAAGHESEVAAFISDVDNDVVDIIDRHGNVTTLPVTGPYNGTPRVLSAAGVIPIGVAVDRNGNVAVSSVGTFSTGLGGVAFYARGATKPTKIVQANSKFGGDYYCAFDAHGNLYVDSQSGSGPWEAGVIAGGVNGNAVTPLTTKNLVQYPGGMQVTRSERIAILDQAAGGQTATISTYDPPKGHSLGNPISTTALSASNNAVASALTNRTGKVLTGDTFSTLDQGVKSDHQNQIGQAQWFDYPSGGASIKSTRLAYNATIAGVALNQPQMP